MDGLVRLGFIFEYIDMFIYRYIYKYIDIWRI